MVLSGRGKYALLGSLSGLESVVEICCKGELNTNRPAKSVSMSSTLLLPVEKTNFRSKKTS